jgi:hypothetical protein
MIFLNSGSDGSIFELNHYEIIKIYHTEEKKQKELKFLNTKYKILDNIFLLPKYEYNNGLVFDRADGLFVYQLNHLTIDELILLWNDFINRYDKMIDNGYLYFDLKVNNVVYYENKIMLIDCSGIVSIEDYEKGNYQIYKNNYRSPNYFIKENKVNLFKYNRLQLPILEQLFIFLFDFNIHFYHKPLEIYNYNIYFEEKNKNNIIYEIQKLIDIRDKLYINDCNKKLDYKDCENFGLEILYQIYYIIFIAIN